VLGKARRGSGAKAIGLNQTREKLQSNHISPLFRIMQITSHGSCITNLLSFIKRPSCSNGSPFNLGLLFCDSLRAQRPIMLEDGISWHDDRNF